MSNEIVKKIEAMKTSAERLLVEETHDKLDEIQNDISTGYITACDELADFILAEQKKENEEFEKVFAKIDAYKNEIYPNGRTKGDVIRESNKSLAEILFTVLNGQDCDSNCPAYKECDSVYSSDCRSSLLKYLNQPQEDTNE